MILTGTYPYNAGTVEFSSRINKTDRSQIFTVTKITENGNTLKTSGVHNYTAAIGETEKEEGTAILFDWACFFFDRHDEIPADLARIVRKFCSVAQLQYLGISNN